MPFIPPVIGFCPMAISNFRDFICVLLNILSMLVPLLAALALLAFLWGLAKFVYSAGSESAREEAKNVMFWGVIGLFVMVSIWGIVWFFFSDIFGGGVGANQFGIPSLPKFPQ